MYKKTKRSVQWVEKKTSKIGKHDYAGQHLIAEFWHGRIIDSPGRIEKILLAAVKEAKSTPLQAVVHKFSPHGITGVVLLAESHIAVHTWPEINYVAVDIFTCGRKSMPEKALEYLQKAFQPKKIVIKKINRGRLK